MLLHERGATGTRLQADTTIRHALPVISEMIAVARTFLICARQSKYLAWPEDAHCEQETEDPIANIEDEMFLPEQSTWLR